MFEDMSEKQARKQILSMVSEYCDRYHNVKKPFVEGQRIPYASRVYDHDEMVNLVDASLEFWLTSGRFSDQFEHDFAEWLGVQYCSLVNSGSSANLLAFMALTAPELGDRRILPGDVVRHESVSAAVLDSVQQMLQRERPTMCDRLILYHLDQQQFNQYENEELERLYLGR